MTVNELSRRRMLALTGIAATCFSLRSAFAGGAPSVTSADGSFDRVKSADLLVFGTSNDEPFSFIDAATNEVAGIDAEMLLEMLKRLGVAKHQVLQVSFDGLIPSLMSSRIDVICDAMYITEKRKKVIDFSQPFYQYGEALLVRKGNPKGLHSLDDLKKGAKVASPLGTVYLDWLKGIDGAEAISYSDAASIMQDLKIGRIDAALFDAPVAGYALKKSADLTDALEIVGDYQPKEIGRIGAGFRKADVALREALDWALNEIKKDGTDLAILKKWGLSEINRSPVV